MANILEAFGVKSASKLQFKNKGTGVFDLWLPFANSIALDVKSDETNANVQGAKAITWSSAKEGTLTISAEVTNFAMLSLMLGAGGMQTENIDIFERDFYTLTATDVSNKTITLTDIPKTGTLGVVKTYADGSSYQTVFIVDTEGTTPPAGHVLISGKIVTFNVADIAEGDKIACMYFNNKVGMDTFTVSTVSESTVYEIYGNTLVKMLSDGSSKFMQLQIFNATVQQSATLNFDSTKASGFEIKLTVTGDSSRLDSNGEPIMFKFASIA